MAFRYLKNPPDRSAVLMVRTSHEIRSAFLRACRKEGRTGQWVIENFLKVYTHNTEMKYVSEKQQDK